jgi:hypothetical protein
MEILTSLQCYKLLLILEITMKNLMNNYVDFILFNKELLFKDLNL